MVVALYSFNTHAFDKALQLAESSGVKYVEGFTFHEVGPLFSDSTMGKVDDKGIALMNKMLLDHGLSMTSMYVDGAKDVKGWQRFFEIGKQMKMSYLVTEPARKHWHLLDSLAGIYNIKVAIHEHAKGESYYWHPDSVLAAMKGHPNIGACADLGHWMRSGLDPVECLKKLEGRIIGIHLKDVAAAKIDGASVNPGAGVIDFAAITRELERQRFDGYIHVECEHNMENNLNDVKQAITYFNNVSEDTKQNP